MKILLNILVVSIYITLLFPLPGNAQPDIPTVDALLFSIYRTYDITKNDTIVYQGGHGENVYLYDVSDPENPSGISVAFTENAAGFCSPVVDFPWLYVVSSRLEIFDISNPYDPVNVFRGPESVSWIKDINLWENYAITYEDGLVIYDVSVPAVPQLVVNRRIAESRQTELLTDYPYLYVATDGDLFVYDISEINAPVEIASINATLGHACEVLLHNDLLYVTDDDVQIFDVSDPANISLVGIGGYDPHHALGMAIDYPMGIISDGPHQISVVNISEPPTVNLIGMLENQEYYRPYWEGVVAKDGYAYFAFWDGSGPFGLYVIDYTAPDNPQVAGSYLTVGLVKEIDIIGNYAFLHDYQTHAIRTIDISIPQDLVEQDSIGYTNHRISGFDHYNNYLFAGSYSSNSGRMRVIDVTHPDNLEQLYSWGIQAFHSHAIGNGLLFVSTEEQVEVYDLVPGPRYQIIAEIQAPSFIRRIATFGEMVAFLDDEDGLLLYDTHDRTNPQLVGSLELEGPYGPITMSADRVYISNLQQGVWVIDITNPADPVIRSTIEPTSIAFVADLDYQNGALWVTQDQTIIEVFDVTNADEPIMIGHRARGDNIRKTALAGEFAIISEKIRVASVRTIEVDGQHGNEQLELPLRSRFYELVTSPVRPAFLNAEDVFGSIQNLNIAQNDDGGILLPELGINTIGTVDLSEAYQLFCEEPSAWVVQGEELPTDFTYSLAANRWNWLGHLYQQNIDASTALAEVEGAIIIATDVEGGAWIPGFINTLGDMHPGRGLMVFANADITFNYPQPEQLARTTIAEPLPTAVSPGVSPTGIPWIVLVEVAGESSMDGIALLEARNTNGELIGSAIPMEGQSLVPLVVWGKNSADKFTGAQTGEAVTIRGLDDEGNSLTTSKQVKYFGNPYGHITLVNTNNSNLPEKFTVSNPYPQPFNPAVTIPFTLPGEGDVSLIVYNIQGQVVFKESKHYPAGVNRYLVQSTKQANNLVSGIYIVTLSFKGESRSMKIVLVR
ncbi:T9SS type A sorting domain-containing protein [bacterium]|nr:T9SS type A sorting domain-containing protein [bacterium]